VNLVQRWKNFVVKLASDHKSFLAALLRQVVNRSSKCVVLRHQPLAIVPNAISLFKQPTAQHQRENPQYESPRSGSPNKECQRQGQHAERGDRGEVSDGIVSEESTHDTSQGYVPHQANWQQQQGDVHYIVDAEAEECEDQHCRPFIQASTETVEHK
jgi:hypothetical protein